MPDDDTTNEPGTVIDLDANQDELSVLTGKSHKKMRLEIEGDDDGSWFRVPHGWGPLLPALKDSEKLVALYLCSCANRQWLAWPSRPTIIEKTGLQKTAVSAALKVLKERGMLSRRRIKFRRRIQKSWLIHPRPSPESDRMVTPRNLFDAVKEAADKVAEGAQVCPRGAGAERPRGADKVAAGAQVCPHGAGAERPPPADKSAPHTPMNRRHDQNDDDGALILTLMAEGFDAADARAIIGRCGPKTRGILQRADAMEADANRGSKPFRKSRFHYLAWAFTNPHFVSVEIVERDRSRREAHDAAAVKRRADLIAARDVKASERQQAERDRRELDDARAFVAGRSPEIFDEAINRLAARDAQVSAMLGSRFVDPRLNPYIVVRLAAMLRECVREQHSGSVSR